MLYLLRDVESGKYACFDHTAKRTPFEIRPTIIRAKKKRGQDHSELGRGVPEITGAKGSPDYIVYLFRRVNTRIVFRTRWHPGLFASFTGKDARVYV